MIKYRPEGVCAREISFDIEGDIIKSLNFKGGCPGNLIGIKSLVEGDSIENVIEKLEGIRCGAKSTSCPDQFAKALKLYLNSNKHSA